jgi:maltodextrin utilization protein YvdJ
MILIMMADRCAHVLDVQGAFLNGRFEEGTNLCLEIPEGFEKYYGPNHKKTEKNSNVVLWLLRTWIKTNRVYIFEAVATGSSAIGL